LHAFLVDLAAGDAATTYLEAATQRHGFYVMEIALPEWDQAPEPARAALVDHELCHYRIDADTGELKITAHDVEEFIEVVARHGAWQPDIAALVDYCGSPV
ncbi:MAG: hypothetical protein L0Z49_01125, partial [Actinobacteria bacterium]|nr:hypothetical protein [Actinomycetota bacterium]